MAQSVGPPRLSTTQPIGNLFTPPIPQPAQNNENMLACLVALKTNVESLTGQRGEATNRAVTFRDLVQYGILDQSAVTSPRGIFTGGGGGGAVTSVAGKVGAVRLVHTDIDDWITTLAPYALLASPVFIGDPRAPTPATTDNDTSVATTAFVKSVVAGLTTGVSSFNTRTGAVTLITADVMGVGGALLASPLFTGDPRAPTPTVGDNDTSIATTAFVQAAIGAIPTSGVTSFNTRTGAVTLTSLDVTNALTFTPYNATNPAGYQTSAQVTTALTPYAPLASPVFTGTPSLPTGTAGVTQAAGNNSTALATTGFVATSFAPLSAPVFVGDARAVTPAVGDNDTSIATSQFVQTAVAPAQNNVGRNYVQNPYFNVLQRGSGPWTTSGAVTADRWSISLATDVVSVTLVGLADADRAGIGDEFAKVGWQNVFTGNAAAGAYNCLVHRIEDARRLFGKTVTLSFWAKAAAGTPKLGINGAQNFGTGGSPSAVALILATGIAVTISTVWARYSVTLNYPSRVGKTLGTNDDSYSAVEIGFSSGAGSNAEFGNIGVQSGTIQLWGVQLEVGTQATPLEKIDTGQDLRNCQRFYQVGAVQINAYGTAGSTVVTSWALLVQMRAGPTMTAAMSTEANCSGSSFSLLSNAYVRFTTNITTTAGFAAVGTFTASADL